MKTIRDYVILIKNIEAEGFTQAHADAKRLKLQQEKETPSQHRQEKTLARFSLPFRPANTFVVDGQGNKVAQCINSEDAVEVCLALNTKFAHGFKR
jgi:hypothetical protein